MIDNQGKRAFAAIFIVAIFLGALAFSIWHKYHENDCDGHDTKQCPSCQFIGSPELAPTSDIAASFCPVAEVRETPLPPEPLLVGFRAPSRSRAPPRA